MDMEGREGPSTNYRRPWSPWGSSPIRERNPHGRAGNLFFFYNASFVRVLYFVVPVLDLGPHAVDFSRRKNQTASVGSAPANLGTRGQHVNH
jgi:hypothetical protein